MPVYSTTSLEVGRRRRVLLLLFVINVKIIVTLSQKKCCRGTVQNVMSKFAVNAVQQIDSAIMSGLQKMPWIAVFSAGDETPSTSTMFWPTKAMHSRPVQRPPRVARHVDGTSSDNVDPDLRRRSDSTCMPTTSVSGETDWCEMSRACVASSCFCRSTVWNSLLVLFCCLFNLDLSSSVCK